MVCKGPKSQSCESGQRVNVGKSYRLSEFLVWTRREIYVLLVLAAVPVHGLEPVLVAAELALESGKPSGEHVLNVLARLKTGSQVADLQEARTPLTLTVQPLANVQRYDRLRAVDGDDGPGAQP